MEYIHEQGMKSARLKTAIRDVNIVDFFLHSVISLLSEIIY